MQDKELIYNTLTKKIQITSLLIKIGGILSIVFFISFIVSTFFRTEKALVPFEIAEKGDYTAISVVKLEESKTTDSHVYFNFTTDGSSEDTDGCLRLSKEDAQSDILLSLINQAEMVSPVCIYGSIHEEKTQGSLGGNSFYVRSDILYASLEPEMDRTAIEAVSMILGSVSMLITFFATVERASAKQKIKLLALLPETSLETAIIEGK